MDPYDMGMGARMGFVDCNPQRGEIGTREEVEGHSGLSIRRAQWRLGARRKQWLFHKSKNGSQVEEGLISWLQLILGHTPSPPPVHRPPRPPIPHVHLVSLSNYSTAWTRNILLEISHFYYEIHYKSNPALTFFECQILFSWGHVTGKT